MRKTYTDLINETVEYYKTHPRSVNLSDNSCLYISEQGRCAVGRCCKDDGETEAFLLNHENYTAQDLIERAGALKTLIFKEEYSHLTEIKAWEKLQNLHDSPIYWNELEADSPTRELTVSGREYYEELLATFEGM